MYAWFLFVIQNLVIYTGQWVRHTYPAAHVTCKLRMPNSSIMSAVLGEGDTPVPRQTVITVAITSALASAALVSAAWSWHLRSRGGRPSEFKRAESPPPFERQRGVFSLPSQLQLLRLPPPSPPPPTDPLRNPRATPGTPPATVRAPGGGESPLDRAREGLPGASHPEAAGKGGAGRRHPLCSLNCVACHGLPSAKADPYSSQPRPQYLSWEDYFMAVAFLSAQRSKDPNKQVRRPCSAAAVYAVAW